MSVSIQFASEPVHSLDDTETLLWVGRTTDLQQARKQDAGDLSDAIWERLLVNGGATFLNDTTRFCLAPPLPAAVSRNQSPASPHKITAALKGVTGTTVVAQVWGVESVATVAAAVGRAFPLYTTKTGSDKKERTIRVECYDAKGNFLPDTDTQTAVCDAVRTACRLVDMPPAELTTTAFRKECQQAVADLEHVSYREVVGTDLIEQGFGGIHGVGRAAECPPALTVLEYTPPSAAVDDTIVLVGKGIVYDTGGLSLKTKSGMPGMKSDMGGAAALFGAFVAASQLKVPRKIVLLLCLAENAIGPAAFRNDDILKLYSGKTVEINNSDAEGRLVLGDGVAYATKHYPDANLVLDMATLTGAQLVTTGKRHAGVLANTEEWEATIVKAGLQSGDVVFPMLYAPELVKEEFESKVADMKNSVKDRGNAQASCAGHFVEEHLAEDYKGGWIHVDIAGPAWKEQRGTGYGVALVLALVGAPGF